MAINVDIGDAATNETKLKRVFWGRSNKIVLSRTTDLITVVAGTPADGDAYIAPDDDATHPNEICIWDDGDSDFIYLVPTEGWAAYVIDDGELVRYDGAAWAAETVTATVTESFVIACSDESTALTTGTAKVTFRMPYAFTLSAVRASLSTAQTSGSTFQVDINEAGSSILSTKLTIDNTEKTSTTAATAAVISDSALASDAEITIDIDTVGDGTAKGLKVYLIGQQ